MTLAPILLRDNPWWKAPAQVHTDPDLLRLAASPAQFKHVIPFHLHTDAVYTLRGPRQVGKSTLIKRIVAELIQNRGVPPLHVMYLDVDGAGIHTEVKLRNTLVGYLDHVGTLITADQRRYVFLDEATGVKNWGATIRVLYRQGLLSNVTMIVTGSNALDLKRGGETAPGRRNEAAVEYPDWIMMPLGFRDYMAMHDPITTAALPSLDVFDPAGAYQAAHTIALHGSVIQPLFERYLLTGGYPHATAAEQANGSVPKAIYDLYRSAITGQIRRAGHRETIFREIISWAVDNRLGKEFSWRDVAAGTDIGAKETARIYLEDAEAIFLWDILYRTQDPAASARNLRSPKKLYPADPFSWHVLASWAAGDIDPWSAAVVRTNNPTQRGDIVESVLASHFVRRFGAFALYYRAERGEEEIDFVLHHDGRRGQVEAKYRKTISPIDQRALAKHGGGILATVDKLKWDAGTGVAQIPLSAVLAGFTEQVTLYPTPD